MPQLFTNNAKGRLQSAITDAQTTITLQTGQGALFPAPTGGDFFLATLFQYGTDGEINHEIVRCTARSGDVFTVTRAQEGTSARAFDAASPIELRWTAACATGALQKADNLAGLADTATARTNLGVAIGTDVQAYDAGLQAIAGLTTAANRMIYTTAPDTYAVADLTAAGRALLDDADAAAQRTTLGLGTMATETASNYAKKSADADVDMNNYKFTEIKTATFNSEVSASGTSGAVTCAFANGQKMKVVPTEAITSFALSFPGVGHYQLRIAQGGTAYAVTWTFSGVTAYRIDATAPTVAANKSTFVNFFYDGTNAYYSRSQQA